jgi:hypothetical protein
LAPATHAPDSLTRVFMQTSICGLVPEQREQDDDRDRHAEQPQQNSPSHDSLLDDG